MRADLFRGGYAYRPGLSRTTGRCRWGAALSTAGDGDGGTG
ncbi:hypothetical protein STTU_1114 [Streptomyces sp. Tu6071]|nr:hypothetical protein STTU_1114 [Streptomyces sp. Tu6071]